MSRKKQHPQQPHQGQGPTDPGQRLSRGHASPASGGSGRGAGSADAEPAAASRPVAALWFGVLGALLFWGDMYVMNNGGDLMGKGGSFPEQVYYPYENYDAVVAANPKQVGGPWPAGTGARVYASACQPCHQPSGLGQPGMFPPLAGSDWVQTEGVNRLIRLVLEGASGPFTVNGQAFNGVMPPWRDTLSDMEIAAVLSFVRTEWGNKGSEVTPEKVKAIRDATKDRIGRPWTAEGLLAIPDKD